VSLKTGYFFIENWSAYVVSTANSKIGFGRFLRTPVVLQKIVGAADRALAANGEGKIITVSLIAFLVLWVCFQAVSHQTIDVHSDISEESLWSEQFSLGFKHPPLSAWIFKLWFMAFPRADWAAYLLAGTMVATMLAVIWRLLRDYVDRDRALLGIAALMFVPLFTFHAAKFNAKYRDDAILGRRGSVLSARAAWARLF
jgi:hypothetical protein